MPPKPYLDIKTLDFDNVVATQEEIYKLLPHRYEFMRLDAIVSLDPEKTVAGYHDVRDDDFWVRGHIPSRPIFPGVMMIETAAQLVSYCVMAETHRTDFLGFGGVDDVKFRGGVSLGDRIIMIGKMVEIRPRRCKGEVQGFVNGKMVFQGLITGMWL